MNQTTTTTTTMNTTTDLINRLDLHIAAGSRAASTDSQGLWIFARSLHHAIVDAAGDIDQLTDAVAVRAATIQRHVLDGLGFDFDVASMKRDVDLLDVANVKFTSNLRTLRSFLHHNDGADVAQALFAR